MREKYKLKFTNENGTLPDTEENYKQSVEMYREISALLDAVLWQISRFGWGIELEIPARYRDEVRKML